MQVPEDKFVDVAQAYTRWRKLTGRAANKNAARAFWLFLGLEEGVPRAGLTPLAWKRIAWLNGPHSETMYKAWKAQNAKVDG